MMSMATGPAVVGHGSAVMYRSPRLIGRRIVELPQTGNESVRTVTPLQEIVVAQDPPNTGMFTLPVSWIKLLPLIGTAGSKVITRLSVGAAGTVQSFHVDSCAEATARVARVAKDFIILVLWVGGRERKKVLELEVL